MIEYLKKSKRHLLAALLITAACCGCTVSKAASDVNVPLRDSNSQPRAALPHDINTTPHTNEVDAILAKLDQKSREIKTYEAKIIYLLRQPVLESEILRNGTLYYVNGEKDSKLRINFTSQRQDDEPVPNYREEYFFDGINLTRVVYKSKSVEYRQLTDANKPLNAFDLASEYLPIIGFTNTKELKTNFEISLVTPPDSRAPVERQLHLVTKPQSKYVKDYRYVDFWVDMRTSLPRRVVAVAPQDDIYDILLEDAKVNKTLPKDIFKIEVSADFDKNVIPLEKEKK